LAEVELDEVTKVYEDGTEAVSDLNLGVGDGEFVVLVGPSGCGKTTALRMIAGLETVTQGIVRIGERVVNRVPSKDRDIAMVFQNYALYPHLSVAENMAFGLRLRKVKKREARRRVERAARTLGLEEFLDRKPRYLSGGQRQRVAMGRAIVREPQAFLMDEPLSNLDAKLRVQMRAEIARIQRDLGTTTIYVTHDQTEAMTMADRVAVLKRGVLQQVDTPQQLYDNPANLFVGGFIGSPAMNLLEATIAEEDGGWWARLGPHRLHMPDAYVAARPELRDQARRPLVLGIRPEDLEDAAVVGDAPEGRRLLATVNLVEKMGPETYVHFTIDAPSVLTEDTRELARDRGAGDGARGPLIEEGAQSACVARVSPRTGAHKGATVDLVVDTTRLYFFDFDRGHALAVPATGNGQDVRKEQR
jgi:multiple sugar transport system ATP-binding protein